MEKKKLSKNFLESGIQGLDDIFLGGLLRGNVGIIEGTPGTGKTTFGLEYIYRGAKEFKEKGLIITFDQSLEKIKEQALGFDWDFSNPEKRGRIKIIHMTPDEFIKELKKENGLIAREVKEMEATRLFIDGLSSIKFRAGEAFRENFLLMVQALHQLEVTTFISSEISEETKEFSHAENFLCDTVINFSRAKNRKSLHRLIEVKKCRGQDFISGHHTMRIISHEGIKVYRRVQTRVGDYVNHPSPTFRFKFGIPKLEEMLGGGVYRGSVTMAVGISGTGKTIMGMAFLNQCLKEDGQALLITLDEHPKQFLRNATTLGVPLDSYLQKQKLVILYDSPLELHLDVHFQHIIELVEKHKIKRVVVDSLAAYQNFNSEEAQEFLYTLASYFKKHEVTAFFCYESPELLGLSQISSEFKVSTIADNIILLNYVEISTQMRRAITVPKAKGSHIPQMTKEFVIDQGGFRILDDPETVNGESAVVPQLPLSSYYGVLSRAPARQSPLIEEHIVRGEKLPDSKPLS